MSRTCNAMLPDSHFESGGSEIRELTAHRVNGRPYSLILLEVEEAVTGRGEHRPLIVEAAYRKIIKEYGESLTEDERVTLGAFRIIMEEIAMRNQIQLDAARKIMLKSAVQRWGLETIPKWADLNADQQLASIFTRLDPEAKRIASEDIISKEGKPAKDSSLYWEFEDPQAVVDKIAKVFYEDILKQSNITNKPTITLK